MSLFTAFISTVPGLTCPGLLAPDRRDAGSRRVGWRVHGRSEDRGYVVPQASDLAVAGDACWGSRPMAEHRVMSEDLLDITHYKSGRYNESQPTRYWLIPPPAESRDVVAPLTVLSPGPGLAGTPSRGNGNDGLKRLSRFRGSGVCRQPVPPVMPVVGAQVAADGSLLQFLGKSPPPSRHARRNRQRNLERVDGALVPATCLRGIP